MNPIDLHIAAYRGARWFVTSSTVKGGRKDAIKEIANSDLQVIEDLGLKGDEFTLSGYIARMSTSNGVRSYFQVRQDLLTALKKGGVGELTHPFYGRLNNIVARTWNIGEDTAGIGQADVSITFGVSNFTGIPTQIATEFSNVEVRVAAVNAAIDSDISDNFEVSSRYPANFTSVVSTLTRLLDDVDSATSILAIDASKVDEFAQQLSTFSESITTLVDNPQDLADSYVTLFQTMNGLYTSAEGTIAAFSRLFDTGDGDLQYTPDTLGLAERQNNQNIVNINAQAISLSYSYLNASSATYQTADDVEELSDQLELQYQKLCADDCIDRDVTEAIADLRTVTQEFLDEQKLNARQIITVRANQAQPSVLAYQYYGSTALSSSIALLNGLNHMSPLDGDIEMFSE